tara:strand:- start:61967 stop:63205 length:1239 start_codon:yes stop_codon:yes gene_type:complete
MSHCKSIAFAFSTSSLAAALSLATALSLAAIVATPSVASAQPESLTIDSSTGVAPAAPEAPSAGPVPQGTSVDGASSGEAGGADNAFYGEYLEDAMLDDDRGHHSGTVPTSHTVTTGDTLWDLSAYYFRNAWDWPKVWKLNPEIADPHWIYPGNIIRLREGGKDLQPVAMSRKEPAAPSVSGSRGYGLRQSAYVDLKDLKDAGIVDGSIAEKSLLSVGDSIYVTYGKEVPAVGTTLAVYGPGKKIRRDGKAVGAYVEVAGEIRITFAKKGKRARATVIRSIEPIERGMRTGPLKLNFSQVKPLPSDSKVDGTVVGLIGPDELIGAEAAVLIDRGSKDGVQVGNRFLVVRRGDAYRRVLAPGDNVGQADDEYPARAIGEIIVLQTGEQACLGVVSFSIHEFGIGDRVFMRKGQ